MDGVSTGQRGRVRVERTAKRIRVQLAGSFVADSTDVLMVWEKPYYPTYYFPAADVRMDLLSPTGAVHSSPSRGDAEVCSVKVAGAEASDAARWWTGAEIAELDGRVSFAWHAFDHWYEEDEEVFVHARDPYTRIDILQSSRHVVVRVDGVEVANSMKPRLLFETGLPVRYYLPKTDVAMQHLSPTETETACPYKGTARYWSVEVGGDVHRDVAWAYEAPFRECAEIAGYVAFYDERADVTVDGVLQERPQTKFA